MRIESERLRIQLLSVEEYGTYLEGCGILESRLGLVQAGEVLDAVTQNALRWNFQKGKESPSEYLWYGLWLLILKEENRAVGNAGFIGPPDEEGEVEIHYGTYLRDRNRGYMGEAVSALCNWAFTKSDVFFVTAEIEKGNTASEQVVKKCGMDLLEETARTRVWFLKSPDYDELHRKIDK